MSSVRLSPPSALLSDSPESLDTILTINTLTFLNLSAIMRIIRCIVHMVPECDIQEKKVWEIKGFEWHIPDWMATTIFDASWHARAERSLCGENRSMQRSFMLFPRPLV